VVKDDAYKCSGVIAFFCPPGIGANVVPKTTDRWTWEAGGTPSTARVTFDDYKTCVVCFGTKLEDVALRKMGVDKEAHDNRRYASNQGCCRSRGYRRVRDFLLSWIPGTHFLNIVIVLLLWPVVTRLFRRVVAYVAKKKRSFHSVVTS
jgi:hypothetical protein